MAIRRIAVSLALVIGVAWLPRSVEATKILEFSGVLDDGGDRVTARLQFDALQIPRGITTTHTSLDGLALDFPVETSSDVLRYDKLSVRVGGSTFSDETGGNIVQRAGVAIGDIGIIPDLYTYTATLRSAVGTTINFALAITDTTLSLVNRTFEVSPGIFVSRGISVASLLARDTNLLSNARFSLRGQSGRITDISLFDDRTKIPEPWTLILIMAGLMGLGLIARVARGKVEP